MRITLLLIAPAWLAALSAFAVGQPADPSPAAAILAAAQQPAIDTDTRFLWLGHLPPLERARLAKVLAGHVNALSREAGNDPPPMTPDGCLIRISLTDYGWPASVWDALPDPYFTALVEVVELVDTDFGIETPRGWVKTETRRIQKKVRKRLPAPWLGDGKATAALVQATGSVCPVARGDWWLHQTAINAGRGNTGYYSWIGVKNAKDYERLLGLDAKLAKQARYTALLEAVSESGVAQEPRRIGAFPTFGGREWVTFDNELATDKANPLRVLDDAFEYKAEERIGVKANGWLAWLLNAADGTLQDSAPDFIGYNHSTTSLDGRIHAGLGCYGCHYIQGKDGFRDVDGWVRGLVPLDKALRLQSPDKAILADLRRKYLRDMQGPMDDDRRTHARAVRMATGWEPEKWATETLAAFARYESPVTAARAAREYGLTEAEYLGRLDKYLKATGALDTVLAGHLGGKRIPLRQWEEVFPVVNQVVRGIVTP